MPDTVNTTEQAVGAAGTHRVMARALTALRIFTGLVWFSNGLAKLIDKSTYDWGFISFNLINRGVAQSIATDASAKTYIKPLGAFYRDVVLPHWGFFGTFLTIAELAIGLGLLFGVASRLAAVGGLLLIGPIWLMLLHTGLYLWQYPAEDLFPLLLLAIVPAGRVLGADRVLAPRFGHHWPF
ncbi:DoxX family membrane protein [Amycolatopsis sp. H20-H5]|uniref:DoxX family membrane protein n=1 Tax=Amycolatopsis sp. H20-H5 TaxID=3046309 RepID=UPI002DBEE4BC|nr:DoxX family membrane protein [Amycolatopsis sp. H20-H5]MEC3975856.1 DoxX family membrane protein [Amycolatopsis sp. H20-H5]